MRFADKKFHPTIFLTLENW